MGCRSNAMIGCKSRAVPDSISSSDSCVQSHLHLRQDLHVQLVAVLGHHAPLLLECRLQCVLLGTESGILRSASYTEWPCGGTWAGQHMPELNNLAL